MNHQAKSKREQMNADFHAKTGAPFSHFYCPILFRDEDVPLCKAHIVNKAFPDSERSWTVQREDVDNFFGAVFEGDFVGIQYRDRGWSPDDCIADPGLKSRFQPTIQVEGTPVDYYVATGPVPAEFTNIVLTTRVGDVRLTLKMRPDDVAAHADSNWQITVEKDLRLQSLVSVLKSAHLTLFEMLGYSYGLSLGRHFLGHEVLGKFFLQNRDQSKSEALALARSHFAEFKNMVRPVTDTSFQGTATDNRLCVCPASGGKFWAFIVFVRTSRLVHAVLAPIMETSEASHRFLKFLKGDGGTIEAKVCEFKNDEFLVRPDSMLLSWPTVDLL